MFVDVVESFKNLSLPYYDVKLLFIISQRNALYCIVPFYRSVCVKNLCICSQCADDFVLKRIYQRFYDMPAPKGFQYPVNKNMEIQIRLTMNLGIAVHSKIGASFHLVVISQLTCLGTIYTNSVQSNLNKAYHFEGISKQLTTAPFGYVDIFFMIEIKQV